MMPFQSVDLVCPECGCQLWREFDPQTKAHRFYHGMRINGELTPRPPGSLNMAACENAGKFYIANTNIVTEVSA